MVSKAAVSRWCVTQLYCMSLFFPLLFPPLPFLQVLVLRELAVYSPTLFYQSVQQFFDNIYGAIRDPRVSTEAHGLLVA